MARVSAARREADRLLFKGRWHPVTKKVSFFATDAHTWVTEVVASTNRPGTPEVMSIRTVDGDLESQLAALAPLEGRTGRLLVVSVDTAGPYRTAVFGNWFIGSDLNSYRAFFARNKVGSVEVRSCPENMRGQVWGVQVHGIHELSVVGPTPAQSHDRDWDGRIVGVRWGSRDWEFFENGPPLPFEDTAAYLEPRDRDKFSQEMLIDYSSALGIRPFDEDFYAPGRTGTIVQYTTRAPRGNRLLSVVEAQTGARVDGLGVLDPNAEQPSANVVAPRNA